MQPSHRKRRRPIGVTAIAIIAAAGGVFSIFGGASVLTGMASGPTILAVIVIVFGILGLTLGAGFYMGTSWAWTAGIVIYIVSNGLGVAEVLYGGTVGSFGGVIRIIAGILIPVYLTRKSPKSSSAKISLHPTHSPDVGVPKPL